MGTGGAAHGRCRLCLAVRWYPEHQTPIPGASNPDTQSVKPLRLTGVFNQRNLLWCSCSFWDLHHFGEQSEQEGLHLAFWGAFNQVVLSDSSISKNKSWFLVPNQPSAVTFLIPVLNKNGLVDLSAYENCRCLYQVERAPLFPFWFCPDSIKPLPKYRWDQLLSTEIAGFEVKVGPMAGWVSNICWGELVSWRRPNDLLSQSWGHSALTWDKEDIQLTFVLIWKGTKMYLIHKEICTGKTACVILGVSWPTWPLRFCPVRLHESSREQKSQRPASNSWVYLELTCAEILC